jgi:hypothetical protein
MSLFPVNPMRNADRAKGPGIAPDARAPIGAPPFRRGHASPVSRSAIASKPSSPPTPFKPLARAFTNACAGIHQRLLAQGTRNPSYLGADRAEWVYMNEQTGEVGIRQLGCHTLLQIGEYASVCLVKPDGRIIYNGENLTEAHPELPRIHSALESLLDKVAADDLSRSNWNLSQRLPPWHPECPGHSMYVP